MGTKLAGDAAITLPAPVEKSLSENEVARNGHNDEAEPDAAMPISYDSGKRRMPDRMRRYLLKVQGGKLYLPAAYRIAWFRDECPDWGVSTTLIEGGYEAGYATVQSVIYNPDGRIIASGIKTESRQDFPAGWVEKAETGSIARALAVAGFGTQFTPELDEETSDTPVAGA